MSLVGFEPTISAGERPQTYAFLQDSTCLKQLRYWLRFLYRFDFKLFLVPYHCTSIFMHRQINRSKYSYVDFLGLSHAKENTVIIFLPYLTR